MLKKIIFLLLSAVTLGHVAYAQKGSISATITPAEILIGEQAVIDVEVIVPKDATVIFPHFNDSIVNGVEVLTMLPVDTTATEVWTLSQKYIVTSFDSMLYTIPPIPVLVGNDTLRSNSLGLKVLPPVLPDSVVNYLNEYKASQSDSINFSKLSLHDIKPIKDAKFVLSDYLYPILIGLGVLMLIALIVVLYMMIKNKRKKGYYFKPKEELPPHVVALEQLNELKERKLAAQGREKDFYVELTDILRQYFKRRYQFDATEMLTGEIISSLKSQTVDEDLVKKVDELLSLADLVKFAKFTPMMNECDESLETGFDFVNRTKIVPQENPNEEKTEDSSSEVKQSVK